MIKTYDTPNEAEVYEYSEQKPQGVLPLFLKIAKLAPHHDTTIHDPYMR